MSSFPPFKPGDLTDSGGSRYFGTWSGYSTSPDEVIGEIKEGQLLTYHGWLKFPPIRTLSTHFKLNYAERDIDFAVQWPNGSKVPGKR